MLSEVMKSEAHGSNEEVGPAPPTNIPRRMKSQVTPIHGESGDECLLGKERRKRVHDLHNLDDGDSETEAPPPSKKGKARKAKHESSRSGKAPPSCKKVKVKGKHKLKDSGDETLPANKKGKKARHQLDDSDSESEPPSKSGKKGKGNASKKDRLASKNDRLASKKDRLADEAPPPNKKGRAKAEHEEGTHSKTRAKYKAQAPSKTRAKHKEDEALTYKSNSTAGAVSSPGDVTDSKEAAIHQKWASLGDDNGGVSQATIDKIKVQSLVQDPC
jgi:hypothetical protein